MTKKSSRDQSTSSVQNIAKAGIPSSRRGDKRRRREEFIIDIGLTKWYKYRTTLGDKKTPSNEGLNPELDKDTLYSFRHTGAIEIFKRTGSIHKLQRAMGHSSLNVSLTYLRGLEVAELKEEDMPMIL